MAPNPSLQWMFNRFARLYLGVSLALCGAALAWQGVDFFLGVLLGCLVAGANFWWTKSTLSTDWHDNRLKNRVVISYAFRLSVTAVVLFIAIMEAKVNPLAILMGLGALLATIAVYPFAQRYWR